jgi:hypothetical protein
MNRPISNKALQATSHQVKLTSIPMPAKRLRRRSLVEARGVVPPSPGTLTATDGQLGPGGGTLVFHSPCDAPAGTQSSNDGGSIITNLSLQLLFWGSAWNSNPSPSIGQVINSVNSILQGPYLSGLGQYGVAGGSLKGSWIVTGREPNNPFSNDDVHSLISDLIDQGSFPEPDDPGGRNLYMFVLPANIRPNTPNITGLHTYDTDYDFPFDIDKAWFGWITHNGTIDSLTTIFSHELVEACTDPEGDGVQVNPRNDTDWHEICDVCCSNARVDGVLVQSYWSDRDMACIVPVIGAEISVAPDFLEFGKLHRQEPSNPKPVQITNIGGHPVTVSIPPSPPLSLHPTFVWDGAGNHQLNPSQNLQLDVTFIPRILGLNAGELKFTSTAIGSPFVVHLRGQGVPGSAS